MKILAESICNFIQQQAKDKGASSLVVRVSGGVDTAVSAALCARTGIRTVLVMDKGGEWGRQVRCRELAKGLGAESVEINLDVPFRNICSQIKQPVQMFVPYEVVSKARRRHERALQAVMRTPVIDYLAKLNDGIIVGAANMDEDMFIRCYHRRGSGAVDIQPLAEVHKSEIYELARYLEISRSIISASSSADIWGGDETRPPEDLDDIHISSVELEWARKEADAWLSALNHYIYDSSDPSPPGIDNFHELDERLFFMLPEPKHSYLESRVAHVNNFAKNWDERQGQVMKKVIELEFSSRHKANDNIPVFQRDEDYRPKKEASMQDFCGQELMGQSIMEDDPTEINADRWL